jgi:hypothetical protein
MTLSRQSLLFLKDTVDRMQLPVGNPGWRQSAQLVMQVQDELDEALAATGGTPAPMVSSRSPIEALTEPVEP